MSLIVDCKMRWFGFLLLFIANCNGDSVDFKQKDYKVIHDHINLIFFDKSVAEHMVLKNQKFNRTARTFGAEFNLKRDLSAKNFKLHATAFKFMSNEYKKFAPITFRFNICDALQKNSFGVQSITSTSGNLTLCPLKKGAYYVNQFALDDSKLPPYIPEGKYRMEMAIYEAEVKVGAFAWQGAIEKLKKV